MILLPARLGAFGWASPPSESTVDPNVGLYDARAALQWVQDHIHKFGGNAADVTVFGQSAGGGIIMHAITAYGGARDPPLFQKVSGASKFKALSNQVCSGYPAISRFPACKGKPARPGRGVQGVHSQSQLQRLGLSPASPHTNTDGSKC